MLLGSWLLLSEMGAGNLRAAKEADLAEQHIFGRDADSG